MKYEWKSMSCFGPSEATSILQAAEDQGAVEKSIHFCGLAIRDQGSIIDPRTAIAEPQFVIFAKFPKITAEA